MKLARNRLHAEDKQEEIEAIERPPKEGCDKSMPLLAAQPAEVFNDRHSREHIRP
jgi:hypothetical protein